MTEETMVALTKSIPQSVHHVHFPNESAEYRKERNALLEEEMKLRRQVEQVAARAERFLREEQSRKTMRSRVTALTASRRP
jgi:predicted dithiol-disulfide oxidoreductase (DUF899 family)